MAPMEDANWQWGPGFAPTVYVAHWCVIDHCMGVMAAHGCPKQECSITNYQ